MYVCMNETVNSIEPRQAVVSGLAVVGFIALVSAGIWLAVYSTRYVPSVVNRVGAAAVYLGSVFTPAPGPTLSVVPTASTTISFGDTSPSATTTTVKPATQTPSKPAQTTAGAKTNTTYQISGGSPTTGTLSGLPDFVTTISAIGYLTTTPADSFVASTTVPAGGRPAVRFTIKNIGTNVSGTWRFSASIPTQSSYLYQSQPQQSLNPGDSIDYTLGFDQAISGVNKMISITANFDRTVAESNLDNNSASAQLTILGS